MMKRFVFLFAAIGMLFACTPEENNTGDNNGNDGVVHVTGISLDRPTATIKEGESITLVATVAPDNATNKAVTWSTSSDVVATVDNNGRVTGVKAGSVTITAMAVDGGMKATCSLSVEASLAPSVTVEANHISAISAVLYGKANLGSTLAADLYLGFLYSTSAGILPSNSTSVKATDADENYYYTTSITGLETDTKYYFRSFVRQNGQYTYGETKEFTTKELASMLETNEAGDVEATKATLNAKLDLTDVQYKSLAYGFLWGSSETALNTDIKVTQTKDDTISAALTDLSHKTQYWYKAYVALDGQSFYGEVKTFTTDVVPVESVSLDKTEYIFHTIGNTQTLKATIFPTEATDKGIEWSSDNEDVVTVDQNGVVKAVGNGTATITVTTKDQGKTATCAITVAQWVTGITFSMTTLSLLVGEEETISVTSILPDNAYDKTYTWSSSDNSIALVDQDGKITAKAKGDATIKVTANDGSEVFASCEVRVLKNPCPAGAVDLGLSVYWATCNLCEDGFVSKPEAYGDYYAWGETETKDVYTWFTYKWCNGSSITLTKYNTNDSYGIVDNKTVLDPGDDAAHLRLGGSWRMPTDAEWTELLTKCARKSREVNGVRGLIVTSRINGNSIFLPAAGSWINVRLQDVRCSGGYWSSSLNTDLPSGAWAVGFDYNSRSFGRGDGERYFGMSVRPVSE